MREHLREQLLRHEGEVLHAYQDHRGYTTIGVGRLIDEQRGGGISHDEAMYLLDNDIRRITAQLRQTDWYLDQNSVRKQAVANMAFQLGVEGLLSFERMIHNMRVGYYGAASDEALDSLWAKQTPERAREIAAMIRSGEHE